MPSLTAGVPSLAEYEALVASGEFVALEEFSNSFLRENRVALSAYARRWVPDPLHGWSRQWEYPFVLEKLAEYSPRPGVAPGRLDVLDAGAGATFFPFFVAARFPGARVACCDRDSSLLGTFARLQRPGRERVSFEVASLHRLPWRDDSFDALYCISVLEHTGDRATILHEFRRVLRPGGTLIVTFDVSLDGRSEVDLAGAMSMLEDLRARFEALETVEAEALPGLVRRPDILTTDHARRARSRSLPWRRSIRGDLKALVRFRWPEPAFFSCTVCCAAYRKRAGDGSA